MDSLSILAAAAAAVQQQEHESILRYQQATFDQSLEPKDRLIPDFIIRRGQYSDVPRLAQVERSAAEKFRAVRLDFLADGDTMHPERLYGMVDTHHLWVASDKYGPIGFLGGENLSGSFHIAEISVAQEWQGRGVGGALMAAMLEQITLERSYRSVTLTTFRELPWNGPWYARLGFHEVNPRLVGGPFEHILETEEAELGVSRKDRCLMLKPLYS